jgi:hypothetical protein
VQRAYRSRRTPIGTKDVGARRDLYAAVYDQIRQLADPARWIAQACAARRQQQSPLAARARAVNAGRQVVYPRIGSRAPDLGVPGATAREFTAGVRPPSRCVEALKQSDLEKVMLDGVRPVEAAIRYF